MNTESLKLAIEQRDYEEVAKLCDEIKAAHGPLVVSVCQDDAAEDPCDADGWRLYSYSPRLPIYRDQPFDGPSFDAKLKAGLAFGLDYFSHGTSFWSLANEGPTCRWDTSRNMGVLVWEQDESDLGAKTSEERREDARAFIERYNDYFNGRAFCLFTPHDDNIASCGDLYTREDAIDALESMIEDPTRPIKFVGDSPMRDEVKSVWRKRVPELLKKHYGLG